MPGGDGMKRKHPKEDGGASSYGCLSLETMLRYKYARCTPEEIKTIQAHLSCCPLCSEALEGLETVNSPEKFTTHVHEMIRTVSEVARMYKYKQSFRRMFIPAAASLVLIAGSIGFFKSHTHQNLSDVLFKKYFTPYSSETPITRSDNNQTGPFFEAMVAYEAQQYSEANSLLDKILQSEPESEQVHFYLSMVELTLHRPEASIHHLEAVLSRPDSRFAIPAQWYLGLAHLKKGEPEIGLKYFEALTRHKNHYSEISWKIVRELKRGRS